MFTFVSFDITAHAAERDQARQVARIAGLNKLVADIIVASEAARPIWASGGDGGHVAFPASSGALVPVLLQQLRQWSRDYIVPLRIIGHVGDADTITGADGRTQLVGDGINLCGSLLEVAPADVIIVTAAFMEFFREHGRHELYFHDPRDLYLKNFRMTRVYLCSLGGELASNWAPLHRSDRSMLVSAKHAHAPWDVLYYARRILQTNSGDADAIAAIAEVNLGYCGELIPARTERGSPRSFLQDFDPASFESFVAACELVERQDGEVLCNKGEPGDTMFILLRGELALVVAEQGESIGTATKFIKGLTFGPGDVVGELALALKTERTATLQAVGTATLLSFSYDHLRQFVARAGQNAKLAQALNHFIDQRVVEYVCNHADYLVGLDQSQPGPLHGLSEPWQFLEPFSRRFDFSAGSYIDATDERFVDRGIYVLASGVLTKRIFDLTFSSQIEGASLPLILVDLPNRIVNRFAAYQVRSASVTLIHIGDDGLSHWGHERLERVISHLGRAAARMFEYDVFISFAAEDYDFAVEVKSTLSEQGLIVYLDIVTPGKGFSSYLAGVITSSLLFLVLNTPQLERKYQRGEKTWVEREVDFRMSAFSGARHLLPLRIGGSSLVASLAGISSMDVPLTFDADFAVKIRAMIDDFKEGREAIPCARTPLVKKSLLD